MSATTRSAASAAQAKVYCATLLQASELAAISPGAKEMDAFDHGEGHSACTWSVPGNGDANTLALTFWESAGMSSALVPADSPEEFFEIYVKSAEEVRSTKREVLRGVGLRSALFRTGTVRELYVLTRAGMAHLVSDGLSDAQVEAIGKAVAAP